MSSKTRLILAVLLLCFIGVGIAIYKNRKLGVPLWAGEQSTSWLVEAKVSFLSAEEGPVTIKLSLPTIAEDPNVGQQAGSLGFGHFLDSSIAGLKSVWSSNRVSLDTHALYYRVRIPERYKTGGSGEQVKGPAPVAQSPGFSGSTEKAAKDLIDRSRVLSPDLLPYAGQSLVLAIDDSR
jgi:hypothetical protein